MTCYNIYKHTILMAIQTMSMIYFKVHMNDEDSVQSRSYTELKEHLARYPNGAIGVEINTDGLMQHYYYQSDARTSEIRRYPLRKMGGQYSCMKMYASLETKEAPYFGTPQQITGAEATPELPKDSLFFVEKNKATIEAMKLAVRQEILKPRDKASYFPELPLSQQQQEFLYSGQVKKGISFQEELSKLLDNTDVTIDEKERALRTCISKQSEDLSDEAAVQRKIIQSEFLSLGSILNYPVAILASEKMAGIGTPAPTIGAIRDYYVACIQSHLQSPIASEDLSGYGNAAFALAKNTRLTSTPAAEIVEAPTYKPLSEKEEICLEALNVLLMSRGGENTPENLKSRILNNPKFMAVVDELYIMLNDLKNVADKKAQTTAHPEYEMIYREFFAELVAEDEHRGNSLSQLTSLAPAHLALTALQPLAELHKLAEKYDTAKAGEREDILKKLRAIQKESTNPELSDEATWLLFSHHLMSREETGSLFLECVAYGNQYLAERMVREAPELLQMEGTATDYSGRAFKKCTAYEYAWWAKDTHMRRMLEANMDSETKAHLLVRIDACVANGLTYTEANHEITGSKQFDLSPLKIAYNAYITAYNAWENNSYPSEGRAAVVAAWMKVGLAQRHLPVHYINEYFRKDRSFEPRPDFDEPNLPRELTFYNWSTEKTETLFPLVLTDSSGLGVDFALMRGAARPARGSAVGGPAGAGRAVASIDLAAVSHLDVVRTNDLMLSHKNLEAPAPNLGMSR